VRLDNLPLKPMLNRICLVIVGVLASSCQTPLPTVDTRVLNPVPVVLDIRIGEGDCAAKQQVVASNPQELLPALQKALEDHLVSRTELSPIRVTVVEVPNGNPLAATYHVEFEPGDDGGTCRGGWFLGEEGAADHSQRGYSARSVLLPQDEDVGLHSVVARALAENICNSWRTRIVREEHRLWQRQFMLSPSWKKLWRPRTSEFSALDFHGFWRLEPDGGYVHLTRYRLITLDENFQPQAYLPSGGYCFLPDGTFSLHNGLGLREMAWSLSGDQVVLIDPISGFPRHRLTSVPDAGSDCPPGLRQYLARSAVLSIAEACQRMQNDTYIFPQTFQDLLLIPETADEGSWRGPYIEWIPFSDPWGNPYQYRRFEGKEWGFEVWSLGADGEIGGTGDDADIRFRIYEKDDE